MLFIWEAGQYKGQDGTIFISPSRKKLGGIIFFVFKTGHYKCKQRTQKLADNCIKYIVIFFFAEMTSFLLSLSASTRQNGQTHSNNSTNCLSVFDYFMGLVLKGLIIKILSLFLKMKHFELEYLEKIKNLLHSVCKWFVRTILLALSFIFLKVIDFLATEIIITVDLLCLCFI